MRRDRLRNSAVSAGRERAAVTIRWAGLATWVLVSLPNLTTAAARSSPRFPWWLAAWLTFGGAFWLVSGRAGSDATWVVALALQAAAVVTMVGLLCNGFEGLLLVLVAAQLGRTASLRVGVAALILQTLAAGAAIALHWTPRSALMLMPPYAGFQLFAFFGFRLQTFLVEQSRLEERLRIAHELHDALGHHLTALSLNLEVASHQTSGEAQENVRSAQSLARLLLGDVREMAHSMKDDRETDLSEGLNRLVEVVPVPKVHLDLPVDLHIADPRYSLALLRCAQEFVTNSIRHGGARNVWIVLRRSPTGVELTAQDDGRGATEVRAGHGLTGMRERLEGMGGSLIVEAGGEGFLVRATVPCLLAGGA